MEAGVGVNEVLFFTFIFIVYAALGISECGVGITNLIHCLIFRRPLLHASALKKYCKSYERYLFFYVILNLLLIPVGVYMAHLSWVIARGIIDELW